MHVTSLLGAYDLLFIITQLQHKRTAISRTQLQATCRLEASRARVLFAGGMFVHLVMDVLVNHLRMARSPRSHSLFRRNGVPSLMSFHIWMCFFTKQSLIAPAHQPLARLYFSVQGIASEQLQILSVGMPHLNLYWSIVQADCFWFAILGDS